MKLWLISQEINNDYDTYDSAVVAALTEDDARHTHPSRGPWNRKPESNWDIDTWADPEDVMVQEIGTARDGTEAGVICASFNAG